MSPPPPPSQHHSRPITSPAAVHNCSAFPDIFFAAVSVLFLFSSSPQKPLLQFLGISFPSKSTRRFLGIPRPIAMSISRSSPHHNHFPTPHSLSEWLKPRLPSDSLASWGVKPGTKNVHNLWLELSEGETSLADCIPPIRTVNVLTVRIIGKDNWVLVESHQELSNGTVRYRCRPLSEKMKPYETPEDALFRAIKEELGSVVNDNGVVRIVPGSYKEKVEERNSVSYPGLPARYILHAVDAVVEGLPDGEFCTEEGEEYPDSEERRAADGAVSVRRHFWKWVSPDSLQS